MVYEMCRNFADSELAPNAGDWDKKHEFPREAITKLVRAGLRQCLVESCKVSDPRTLFLNPY
jgi:alkylation response protein AidB-like acyl-CoA dehydrogenase